MSFDDQIRESLERASAALRAQLERDLAAVTEELARVAAIERERAVREAAEAATADARREADARIAELQEASNREIEALTEAAAAERDRAVHDAAEASAAEARRQADAQIAQLRDAAEKRVDELKQAAARQVDELKAALQAQVDEVRRSAQVEAEEARRAADAEIDEARRIAAAQVDDIERRMNEQFASTRRGLEEQLEETRRRAIEDLDAVRVEAEAAKRSAAAQVDEIRARMNEQLAETRRDLEQQIDEAHRRGRAEVDSARADADLARARAEKKIAGHAARSARLVDAVRALDAAGSLTETLDALAEHAATEVDRIAVLIVRNGRLRVRNAAGFPSETSATDLELDVDAAGIVGAVLRTSAPVSWPGTEALPSFAQDAGAASAVALPIVVGGHVVAVLYADMRQSEDGSPPVPALLEVLVRHASRGLETLTIRQALGLAQPRRAAATVAGPLRVSGAESSGDDDAARRYARLLVSEIRMYHEPAVDAGRRSRDLRTRLRDEIDRARRMYEARVPPAVREQSDYFEQELVRTLADGDRSLLG